MRDLHLVPLGVSPDRRSKASLYRQIYDDLRSAILDGRLESGVRLPSTRAAAAELGVARNTMVAVFEQLAAEGFLRSRVGHGTRVADIEPGLLFRPARRSFRRSGSARERATGAASRSPSPSPSLSALSARGREIVGVGRGAPGPAQGAFQPGFPDLDAFPHRTWARILARHARTPERARLGYGDAAGDPGLRGAIVAHVTATRGVTCTPERVVVVAGAQAALDLCARLLLDPGDAAWIEEPGYAGARAALLGAGARLELNRTGFPGGSKPWETGAMKHSNRCSPELRERAVRLVLDLQGGHESQWAAIASVSLKVRCSAEALRKWARRAERGGDWIAA